MRKGTSRPLAGFVKHLPEKPLDKVFSQAELINNPDAGRQALLQDYAKHERSLALDSLAQDLKGKRNLSIQDIQKLSREDLKGIAEKGDRHLLDIINQHEQERGLKMDQSRGR